MRNLIGVPSSEHAELVRKNAEQIEIAARTLRIDRAMRHLHFARGVRERAVFFVGGGGGQNDVRALRGFRQEHVVHHEQFEAGELVRAARRRKSSPDSRRPRKGLSSLPATAASIIARAVRPGASEISPPQSLAESRALGRI